jgi:hypothetical protein
LFEDFNNDARRNTVWTENTLIDQWYHGYPDVHKFENGGYHIKQNILSPKQARIVSTNSLGRPTICYVTIDVVSETGTRIPVWALIRFGYGSIPETVPAYGYWGGVNVAYDPLPGRTYTIQWSDGYRVNNAKLFEEDYKLSEFSFDFGTTKKPAIGIDFADDAMGEYYYRNFYARAYTANPPTHG